MAPLSRKANKMFQKLFPFSKIVEKTRRYIFTLNSKLNDWRKIICLRKSEGSVKKIQFVIENWAVYAL